MFTTITHFDALLFTFINSHHTLFLDRIFLVITQFGNGWVAIPLTALIIVLKTPREFLAKALLCAAIAGLLAGALNSPIKHFVHRDRPALYCTRLDSTGQCVLKPVHVIGKVLRHNSFPSGHANTAFTAATILALFFGRYFYCAYPGALLIAYSRVYVGAHFPLDTAGGAIIGFLSAAIVIGLFRSKKWLPQSLLNRRNDA